MINELTVPLHMPTVKGEGGKQGIRKYTKAERETAPHSRQ